jgi:putative multiple sugar transport system permease protein
MSMTANSQGADPVETAAVGGRQLGPSFLGTLQTLLQQNVREYGMYIALFVIMAVFAITTKGLFVSSRNISNLINQTGYIAVLAVGMTLVIVIRHIDLSVGSLAGFIGAVVAWALVYWGFPVYAAIPLVLAVGVLAGLVTAFLVAQMKIPAFVATLAGWLGYRGALQLVTVGTGTIIIPDKVFNAISNGFVPDIPHLGFLPGIHKLTVIIGLLAIVLFILGQFNDRKKTQAYHFEVLPMEFFVLKLLFVSVLIGGITWVLAGYEGLSWTAVIILIVVLAYNFIMSETDLGRHIYAVGGNPEAAQLSGINVRKLTYVVFCSMGGLSGLSGILYASRLRSATTIAGQGFELDAIAAAFVGGAAVSGGVGKVVGSIIGALVMASLTNGMNLMGIDISLQYIVRALVLAVAVIFDVTTRNRAK